MGGFLLLSENYKQEDSHQVHKKVGRANELNFWMDGILRNCIVNPSFLQFLLGGFT